MYLEAYRGLGRLGQTGGETRAVAHVQGDRLAFSGLNTTAKGPGAVDLPDGACVVVYGQPLDRGWEVQRWELASGTDFLTTPEGEKSGVRCGRLGASSARLFAGDRLIQEDYQEIRRQLAAAVEAGVDIQPSWDPELGSYFVTVNPSTGEVTGRTLPGGEIQTDPGTNGGGGGGAPGRFLEAGLPWIVAAGVTAGLLFRGRRRR